MNMFMKEVCGTFLHKWLRKQKRAVGVPVPCLQARKGAAAASCEGNGCGTVISNYTWMEYVWETCDKPVFFYCIRSRSLRSGLRFEATQDSAGSRAFAQALRLLACWHDLWHMPGDELP